jgi:hypothetical protein
VQFYQVQLYTRWNDNKLAHVRPMYPKFTYNEFTTSILNLVPNFVLHRSTRNDDKIPDVINLDTKIWEIDLVQGTTIPK